MEKGFTVLCSIWNKIGPFNMDRFSDRLILQKKVFLLQEMGLNLGYEFGKYIYGPYCSSLATDGYKAEMKEDSGSPDCSKFITKLEELEKGHKGDSSWFELLGTITFLSKKMNKNKEEIRETIKLEKPYLFEEKLFEEAYSRLVDLEVIVR